MVEQLIVDQQVAGSTPVTHPQGSWLLVISRNERLAMRRSFLFVSTARQSESDALAPQSHAQPHATLWL